MSEILIVKIIGDLESIRSTKSRTEMDDANFIKDILRSEGCDVQVEVKYE